MIPQEALRVIKDSDLPKPVKNRFVENINSNYLTVLPLGLLDNIVFGQRTFDMGEVIGYNVTGGILDLDRIGVFPVLYIREAKGEDLLRVITLENNWRSFDVISV